MSDKKINEEFNGAELGLPEAISQILDPNNYKPISLFNDKGEEVKFDQVANIKLMDSLYVLLKPVVPMEEVPEDSCLCFELLEYENGIELEEVENSVVATAVFEEYLRLKAKK